MNERESTQNTIQFSNTIHTKSENKHGPVEHNRRGRKVVRGHKATTENSFLPKPT